MPQINKAIITAAGFGSRFLPITKTFPKEMLPIIDKPILHYLVEECAEADIEEVIIVASPSEVNKFEDYFYGRAVNIRTLMIRQDKLERWHKVEKVFDLPQITIIPQDERIPYGNGRPILSAKDLVIDDEAFVVLFGDDVVLSEVSAVKQLVEEFQSNPSDVLLGVQKVPQNELSKYGILKLKEGTNEVERVIEKPDPEEAPSDLASYGRFVLTPKIFDYLKADAIGKDDEVWLQDANDQVAQNGGSVRYKVVEGEWMTTGDPLRYMKAHIKYMLNHKDFSEDLKNFLEELNN